MSVIACLGAGVEGLPILARVKALGHQLVVVDGNPDAPGRRLADTFVEASCYDIDQTINGLERLALKSVVRDTPWPYNAVLCCAIDAPNVAAAVAEHFHLPGLTPAQAALSCNKLAQKQALRVASVLVPQFASESGSFRASRAVLKPIDSRGSRGVSIVEMEDSKMFYRPLELLSLYLLYEGDICVLFLQSIVLATIFQTKRYVPLYSYCLGLFYLFLLISCLAYLKYF